MAASNEVCGNCDRKIGKLETPHVWRGHVVCGACSRALAEAAEPAPVAAPARPTSAVAAGPGRAGGTQGATAPTGVGIEAVGETELLRTAAILVTSKRVVVSHSATVFSVANITSVRTWADPGSRHVLLLLAGLGLAMMVYAAGWIDANRTSWIVTAGLGALCLGGGALGFVQWKPKYWVRLSNSGQETNALFSSTRSDVDAIVGAISRAMAMRG